MSLYLLVIIIFTLFFLFRIIILNEKFSSSKIGNILFTVLTTGFWIIYIYVTLFQYFIPFDFYSAFKSDKKEFIIRNDTYLDADLIFLSKENESWKIEYPKENSHLNPHFDITSGEKARVTLYTNSNNIAILNFKGSYKIGSLKSFSTYDEKYF